MAEIAVTTNIHCLGVGPRQTVMVDEDDPRLPALIEAGKVEAPKAKKAAAKPKATADDSGDPAGSPV